MHILCCSDHPGGWIGPQREATHKVHHLMGIVPEPPKAYLAANMSRYGFGTARSVAYWEAFAGVDLKAGRVTAGEKFCRADIPQVVPDRVCPVSSTHR